MRKFLNLWRSVVCLLAVVVLCTSAYAAIPNPSFLGLLNPYIYVSDYEVIEGVIETGEQFTIRLTVTNANPRAEAYNIMMSFYIEGSEGFYIPEGEVNQHYLPYLSGGESTEIDVVLQVKDEFAWPVVVIDFLFIYVNQDGVDHSNNTLITLVQQEKTELSMRLSDVPKTAEAGEKTPVHLQFSNTGKTDLAQVTTTLEGNFAGSPMHFERTNLDAGSRFAVDTYLLFHTPGDETITVKTEYENSAGKVFDIEEETFAIAVQEARQTNTAGKAKDDASSDVFNAKTFWLYITLASGVLIAGIAIIIVVNSKHNHKKRK